MKENEILAEKRTSKRIEIRPYSKAKIYIGVDEEKNYIVCQYTNLSRNGAMFIYSDSIIKGTELRFGFKPAGLDYELSLRGVVRWSRQVRNAASQEQQYFIGIEFSPLNSSESKVMKECVQVLQKEQPIQDNRTQDRRQTETNIHRRVFNRRTKEFLHEETVYLFDTNAVGNTYFAQHFIWQGKIREAFLGYILGGQVEALMRSGVKLITREAHNKYYNESVLFNRVLMRLRVGNVTKTRIELLFQFEHKSSGALISKGMQVIVFGGPNGKPITIPEPILQGIEKFRRQ